MSIFSKLTRGALGGLMGFATGGPVGAVAGAGMGLMGSSGKKGGPRQLPRYTNQQQGALNRLLSQGMSETDMKSLQDAYRQQFERETVPMIAERFSSMGSQGSSAFEDALSRGGVDLASQLAGLQHQGGMQKLGFGLQPQFDTRMEPAQEGMMERMMPMMLGNLLQGGLPGGQESPLAKLLGGLLAGRKKASPIGGAGKVQYFPGQPQGMNLGPSGAPSFLSVLQRPF